MSFWFLYTQKKSQIKSNERRRIRTGITNNILFRIFLSHPTKRTSSSASKRSKASITIEAALAVPIFFFAVVCLFYLLEIMCIQTAVRSGLQYAGKEVAQSAYEVPFLMPGQVEKSLVRSIGAERLERSLISGGSSGIDCSASRMGSDGVAILKANYQIKIPILIFHVPALPYEESMRVKGWTGYEKTGAGSEESIVYVTETGIAYHKNYHCTHLDLSIQMANKNKVGSLRNHGGGKYQACPLCGSKASGAVYITDYGDRYHSSLSCSGLKRTVYAVPLSEAVGKKPCSKCGK